MEQAPKKANYQQLLLDQCVEWWNKYEASTKGTQLIAFDWPRILHDFVKQVALDSFKNGVTVGQRKNTQPNGHQQSHPHRPSRERA